MKTPTADFTRYHALRHQLTAMIRSGQKDDQLFTDAWEEMEQITNRNGGLPPVPTDADALDQELAEMGVEKGLR